VKKMKFVMTILTVFTFSLVTRAEQTLEDSDIINVEGMYAAPPPSAAQTTKKNSVEETLPAQL